MLDVSILIIKNNFDNKNHVKIYTNDKNFKENKFHIINQNMWVENSLSFVFDINISTNDLNVIKKIFSQKQQLKYFLELPRGIEIGSNSDLIFKNKTSNNMPILFGKSINRYQIEFDNNYINFEMNNKSVFKEYGIYNQEKILIQRIRNLSLKQRIVATLDNENYICTNTLRIGILKETNLSIKYLLGILNSNTINWIFFKKFLNKDIYAYQLEQIPIKEIDFSNPQEKQSHDQIIIHVEQLLQLNKEFQTANLASKKEQIKSRIEYNEDKINALVYTLYNLTEDEIKLIEQ